MRPRSLATVLVLATSAFVAPVASGPAALAQNSGEVHYVAKDGADTQLPTQKSPRCPGGSIDQPWRTIEFGMRCVQPGDTLYVRGGTYVEEVNPVLKPATKDAPVLVQAYQGERVLVDGLLRFYDADHWTIDGIDVTGGGRLYEGGRFPVKFVGGTGWTYANGEVWGVRGYAAFRIEGNPNLPQTEPSGWRVSGSCIHDTAGAHPAGQDHNVYIDTGLRAGGGIFEHNIVYNASNGTNLKLGHEPVNGQGTSNVVIRYNTFWNAVQNVLAAGDSANNRVERNIFGKVIRPSGKSWYPNLRGINLDGTGNVAKDNISADGGNMIFNDPESSPGWRDAGGNFHPIAPKFDSTASCSGFRPSEPKAKDYGRWAGTTQPQPDPRPAPTIRDIDDSCPANQVQEDGFRDVPQDNPHEFAIDCVVWRGIASGTSADTYAPTAGVSRAQMATFIARLIEASGGRPLPDDAPDAFVDDDGSPHEPSIDRLAAAGIVSGVKPGYYGPTQTVTRGQMATFLVRAYEYASGTALTSSTDWFTDDERSPHETNINRAATAGFTGGTKAGVYSPGNPVKRDQMASFLARVLDLLLEA